MSLQGKLRARSSQMSRQAEARASHICLYTKLCSLVWSDLVGVQPVATIYGPEKVNMASQRTSGCRDELISRVNDARVIQWYPQAKRAWGALPHSFDKNHAPIHTSSTTSPSWQVIPNKKGCGWIL
eukprot:6188756-Pleurochrysis_carterae.AAC.1